MINKITINCMIGKYITKIYTNKSCVALVHLSSSYNHLNTSNWIKLFSNLFIYLFFSYCHLPIQVVSEWKAEMQVHFLGINNNFFTPYNIILNITIASLWCHHGDEFCKKKEKSNGSVIDHTPVPPDELGRTRQAMVPHHFTKWLLTLYIKNNYICIYI